MLRHATRCRRLISHLPSNPRPQILQHHNAIRCSSFRIRAASRACARHVTTKPIITTREQSKHASSFRDETSLVRQVDAAAAQPAAQAIVPASPSSTPAARVRKFGQNTVGASATSSALPEGAQPDPLGGGLTEAQINEVASVRRATKEELYDQNPWVWQQTLPFIAVGISLCCLWFGNYFIWERTR
jgi:hypothetical protein